MEFAGVAGGQISADSARHDFSALEWLVIALAERDSLASIGRASRFATAIARLFERPRGAPALANPKLEALRRFAVLTWKRGTALPDDEVGAFHAAGYSLVQRHALIASITKGRQGHRSK
jgi:hypothetical protein